MRSARSVVALAVALAGVAALAGPAWAETEPANLGNGLARLLEPAPARHGLRLTMRPLAIRDTAGASSSTSTRRTARRSSAVRRAARPPACRSQTGRGTEHALEGFVALEDVKAVAGAPGVATVSQALKPQHECRRRDVAGRAARSASTACRAGIDGRGITVGALSDSFDVAATDARPAIR